MSKMILVIYMLLCKANTVLPPMILVIYMINFQYIMYKFCGCIVPNDLSLWLLTLMWLYCL